MPNPTTDAETLQRAREAAIPILYRNWRGETAVRRISLHAIAYGNEATGLAFGWNEWHPEEQWLLSAYDIEKGAWRSFAMAGILAWGEEAVSIALDRAAQTASRETAAPVDGDFGRAAYEARFAHEHPTHYSAWSELREESRVVWRRVESAVLATHPAQATIPETPVLGVGGAVPPGWKLVPLDDGARQLADSALPLDMIFSGGDAYDAMKVDETLDLDSGMVAVGIYRAMTGTAPAPDQTPPRGGVTDLSKLTVALEDLHTAAEVWAARGGDQAHRVLELIHPSFNAVYQAYKPLRATLSRQSAGAGTEAWRSIESAPKDGSVVDLWDGQSRRVSCHWNGEKWLERSSRRGDVARYVSGFTPTHWQPLPAPPETPPAGSPQDETGGPA